MTPSIKKTKYPLFGLVLSGGTSTRMGKDKSTIEYHGKSQTEFCYDLLSSVCEKVFISNRSEQSGLSAHKKLPQIHDDPIFTGIGPLAGILTAMEKFPKNPWLVLAIDLPFMDKKTLEDLIKKRDRTKIATAYKSPYDGLPEPLCAIYEAKAAGKILQYLKEGCQCPRKIMILSKVKLIQPKNKRALDNINTKEEHKNIQNELHSTKK